MLLNQLFCSHLFEPCQVIPIFFRCKSLRSPWISLALCSLTHSNAWQTNGEANWQRHRAQRSRAQGVPGNWTSDGGRRTTRWVSYLMAVKPDRLPSAIHHPPSTFYLLPSTTHQTAGHPLMSVRSVFAFKVFLIELLQIVCKSISPVSLRLNLNRLNNCFLSFRKRNDAVEGGGERGHCGHADTGIQIFRYPDIAAKSRLDTELWFWQLRKATNGQFWPGFWVSEFLLAVFYFFQGALC